MNILIAHNHWSANDIYHDGWSIATNFFTHQKLLHVLATLLMVQNDITIGEDYEKAITETVDDLIDRRLSDETEESRIIELSDYDRFQTACYLKDTVKAMRPYMPNGGSLELVTFVSEPEKDKFYLVVRYHPDDEYSNKAFASPGLRG